MNIYPISNEDVENFHEFVCDADFEAYESLDYCIDSLVDDQTNVHGLKIVSILTQLGRSYKNLEIEVNGVKSAIDALKGRKESLEKKMETLNEYIRKEMIATNNSKIKDDYFVMAIKNNPPSVNIIDEEVIPSEYKIEAVIKAISKMKIKEDLQHGVIIPGAELKTSTRLDIK